MRTKGLAYFVILSLIIVSWVSASQILAPVSLPGENAGEPDQKLELVAGQGQGMVQGRTQAVPLQFVKNAGQSGGNIEFIVLSDGGSLFFSPSGVTIKLVTPEGDTFQTTGLAYSFHGADPDPEIIGLHPGESRVNFLVGRDPSSWYTNVPTYGSIMYRDLYPGIDLEYSGPPDGIKSTFTVAPGSSPEGGSAGVAAPGVEGWLASWAVSTVGAAISAIAAAPARKMLRMDKSPIALQTPD